MNNDQQLVSVAVLGRALSAKGWVRANCPLCELRTGRADRKASLGLHVSGRYHCFRCGAGGRLPRDGYDAPEGFEAEPAPTVEPPEGFWSLSEGPGATAVSLAPAREYLRARGLDERRIAEAGIGGVLRGRYGGRVVVPVFAPDGAWLWWVARSWGQSERPYLYPRGDRGDLLYNHDALLLETEEPVLVVEGVFDALALWPSSVAVLGKPTDAHLEALCAARRPIAVVLDGDAWEEGRAIAMRLRLRGCQAGSVRLQPREDPDEVDRDWLFAQARQACERAA